MSRVAREKPQGLGTHHIYYGSKLFFLYRYVLIIILWFIHIEKKIHMHTLNLHHSSSKVLGLGYTMGSKSKWISKIFDPKFQGIFQNYFDHWIQQLNSFEETANLEFSYCFGRKKQCNNRAWVSNLDLWAHLQKSHSNGSRAMASFSKNHPLLMCRIWKMGWNLFSSLDIRENPLFVLFPA